MSAAEVVQSQLDAYNAQDVAAFMEAYAADCVLATYGGDVICAGADAIRARHENLFATFPQNHARLLHRIVLGDRVIDHEHVARSPGGETFEVVVIYTLSAGRIIRADYVRAV